MEEKTKRLEEIKARLEEISKLIEEPGADLEALNKEVDDLQTEQKQIENDLAEEEKACEEKKDERNNLLEKIARGMIGKEEKRKEDNKMEKRTFDLDTKEYRVAFLKKLQGKQLEEVEQRALTSSSTSAGAVVPTETSEQIISKVSQYAPLLDEVTLLHVQGNVTFAVEGTNNDALLHTEGASISASADTLVSVSLGGYEITKLIAISDTVKTMSIKSFESWLVDILAKGIANKVTSLILSGTGSSQPKGVASSATWGTTNSVTVAKTSSLTAGNVQSLISLLPGGYDANAKFLMSKQTLFTAFMPLQDNAKNHIVTREGKDYFIYGYPVMLDSRIDANDAYLGDFTTVVANMSEDITVKTSFDIDTNSYKYLGVSMFDCKPSLSDAFVKLTKATE